MQTRTRWVGAQEQRPPVLRQRADPLQVGFGEGREKQIAAAKVKRPSTSDALECLCRLLELGFEHFMRP